MRTARLAIFTSHPIQYQAPVFRALAQRQDTELTVFFGSDHGVRDSYDSGFAQHVRWDIPLLEGYTHHFLENAARFRDVNSLMGVSVPGIRGHLTSGRFDAALVMGWQTRGHVQALLAARRARIPILLFGESTLEMRPSAGWKAAIRSALWLPLRKVIYSRALRQVSAVLTVGSRNEAYFRSFGVPVTRMSRVGYGIENERFSLKEAERFSAGREIRDRLGLSKNDFVFLSVAKIQDKKRPFDLLAAFETVAAEHPGAALVYVGEGPLRKDLDARVRARKLDTRVRICGFVNQAELPKWYAAGDCLVLPSDSRETWGLAVNEALASGMPVIVSDTVGCAPDLVIDGETGKVFPFGDTVGLSGAMLWACRNPIAERARIAMRATETVAWYSPARVAERIAAAVARVMARR